MSEVNNFTINDGAATPVARTFSFTKEENGVLHFVDRSGGIPAGYARLSVSFKEPTSPNGNCKVQIHLRVPVLEQTSASTMTGIQPAPTLAYELISRQEVVISNRSDLQTRKHLWAFVVNALNNAAIKASIVDLDPVYH